MKLAFRSSLLLVAMLFIPLLTVLAQGKGEATFKQTCAACHSIGKGKLVGPDLKNVQERHPEEWLLKFIKSSQTMVKSGDKYADSLFKAYNLIVMPDQSAMTDGDIKEILTYIKTSSAGPVATAPIILAEPSKQIASNGADSAFSLTNIILFLFILLLLGVIFYLSKIIKNLSDQLMDFYSSDRSFF